MKPAALLLILAGMAIGDPPPAPKMPPGVTPTAESIELGRKLFFDPRLSDDGTVSCSTCHHPATGWADREPLARGVRNLLGNRNSPTIINASYSPLMFHDGRVVGQAEQALLPIVNRLEMGNQSEAQVLNRLRLTPGYVAAFLNCYGQGIPGVAQGSPITRDRFAHALASFQQQIVSFGAPIDRRLAGDPTALSADAEQGFGIFQAMGCMNCHKPPLFTDLLFHNNGAEWSGKMRITDQGRAAVLPDRLITASDVRSFKTPTLREIHRTAPYGHAGQFADLVRVVQHYAVGGRKFDGTSDPFIDPRVAAIRLNPDQQKLLVAFLREAFASKDYPAIAAPELP